MSAFGLRYFSFNSSNSLLGQPQKRFVLRQRFFDGVAEISQQTEVEVVIPICQEADFQRLDQVLDVLSAGEHRRDHDQGARFRRDSSGKVHSRQQVRRRQ